MSIIYCETHDRRWDSDKLEICPLCENIEMTDLKKLVDRFLSWPLPETFAPDCGISFKRLNHPTAWPIGTNLFTADEAQQMLEHILGTELRDYREALEVAAPLLRVAAERGTLDSDGVNLELEAAEQICRVLGYAAPCAGDWEQDTGGDHDQMEWRCHCGVKSPDDCQINLKSDG